MLIDWFTVAAQIVNFLVLVALLKRFLYGRIIRAMDEREAKIAARLREAREERLKAEHELELFREKNDQFDAERERMLALAGQEAEARHRELMHEAREEVDGVRSRWIEALRQERESFLTDLREMTCGKVYDAARRALADLAGVDVEQRIIAVFIEKVRGLDPGTWSEAIRPLRGSHRLIKVRSTFEIPREPRERLAEVLKDRFGDGMAVEFETSSNLICGIELLAHDLKIAWSMADYVEKLEESMPEMIERDEWPVRSGPSAEEDRAT